MNRNEIGVIQLLAGLEVRADHPITCFNPTDTFVIVDAKIEDGKLYVRGEHTIWFGAGCITKVTDTGE